jgi:hypothetical protein
VDSPSLASVSLATSSSSSVSYAHTEDFGSSVSVGTTDSPVDSPSSASVSLATSSSSSVSYAHAEDFGSSPASLAPPPPVLTIHRCSVGISVAERSLAGESRRINFSALFSDMDKLFHPHKLFKLFFFSSRSSS